MADFSGSFQYLGPAGEVLEEGDCRIQFDAQSLTIVPSRATPIAMDLGDLDAVVAANFQVRLPLYTGRTLVLRELGRAFERLSHDLTAAYRDRTLQCLLLEDMEEIGRFPGAFEFGAAAAICPGCGAHGHGRFCPQCGRPLASPVAAPAPAHSGDAEIRLFKSNLAVLPVASQPFQLRLGDVDAVRFEPGTYEVALETAAFSLKLKQLGKRTEEFAGKVRDALSALGATTAQAIRLALPFLNPDELRQAASLLRDGRSAASARLAAIHAKIPDALAANTVDADLRPYYDELLRRTLPGALYSGFKLIRPEDAADSPGGADDASGETANDADASAPATLYWFFFPLAVAPGSSEPANLVAWEAISRSGRATYFFRLVDPADVWALKDPARAAGAIESAVQRLNTALAMLNFRRRPIYLSDDELQRNPTFHRYAIAARRIPEVRQLRAAFVGRAMHTSPDAWQEQVAAILAKSASAAGSA